MNLANMTPSDLLDLKTASVLGLRSLPLRDPELVKHNVVLSDADRVQVGKVMERAVPQYWPGQFIDLAEMAAKQLQNEFSDAVNACKPPRVIPLFIFGKSVLAWELGEGESPQLHVVAVMWSGTASIDDVRYRTGNWYDCFGMAASGGRLEHLVSWKIREHETIDEAIARHRQHGNLLQKLMATETETLAGTSACAMEMIVALIGACRLFAEQRLVQVSPVQPLRPALRRALKAEIDPTVHVVRLRRVDSDRIAESQHDIEWSCQWIVRGHWRHQWIPSQQRNELRWILPYVKGPSDKPLKMPAPEVQLVVR